MVDEKPETSWLDLPGALFVSSVLTHLDTVDWKCMRATRCSWNTAVTLCVTSLKPRNAFPACPLCSCLSPYLHLSNPSLSSD